MHGIGMHEHFPLLIITIEVYTTFLTTYQQKQLKLLILFFYGSLKNLIQF